ncbi:LacI family DNA-binding transcriptional regulator [Aurantimonas sp. VKM B-3413]|uniref:LacI family DNA-binding transcriptional regulator n=1 Tax=Aurantimonas sp. VKM B-3413 TaxID=2779401 RepID=UPI001E4949EA|nr:LacI family DNA-binding transcriptional regulator [Aurantimonas sp. VKM B-3413]MCB8838972.1 LacI family DNA-binding transcriptional regulator [Aurantimonas sp. VKM B-3413]
MSGSQRPGSGPRRRVTALDVARLAGVSRSAVSRALTEGASVSDETRAKVLKAAETLGYHRNALVRGMVRQRSGIIGIVAGRLDNPFIAVALEILSRRLQEDGLKSMIYSGDAESDIAVALPSLVEYRVDGCFFLSNDLSPQGAAKYTRLDIPLVVLFNSDMAGISDHGDEVPVGAITVDNVEISRTVADLLLGGGCRHFAYIEGLPRATTSRERQRGYVERLAERGFAVEAVATGNFNYADGLAAARGLLAARPRPDAIFAANDLMALAVLDVARAEFGLSVPEDVAVVGFDDIGAAAQAAYDLTTVRQPLADMVEAGVDLMLALIEEPDRRPEEIRLRSHLIERSTTRQPYGMSAPERAAGPQEA